MAWYVTIFLHLFDYNPLLRSSCRAKNALNADKDTGKCFGIIDVVAYKYTVFSHECKKN